MNKVEIIFPSLQKGIKQSKDNPERSPYNYVSVKNGHAIVVSPYSVICLNLEDYFLNYQSINEEEIDAFNELMQWIEGKFFTVEFWGYLTSKNKIHVIDEERINVTGASFEKELIYQHNDIDLTNVMKMLKVNLENGKNAVPAVAISNTILKQIDSTLGKLILMNALIFEFNSVPDSTVRFTSEGMSCIFGIVLSSNQCLSNPFNFEQFKIFANS